MSWTPANSIGTGAAHPSKMRILSGHREWTDPSQVVTSSPMPRPHKSFSCNTYKNPGGGAVGNDFHIPAHLTPPHIFRTLFQVPYPATPLLAALTKPPGVWGYSSHSGTHQSTY